MQIFKFTDHKFERGVEVRRCSFSNSAVIGKKLLALRVGVYGSHEGFLHVPQYLEFVPSSLNMKVDVGLQLGLIAFNGMIEDSPLDPTIYSTFSRKRIVVYEKNDDSDKAICVFCGFGDGSFGYHFPTGDFDGYENVTGNDGVIREKIKFLDFPGDVIAKGSCVVEDRMTPDVGGNNSVKLVAVLSPGMIFVTPACNPASISPQYVVWAWNGQNVERIREV